MEERERDRLERKKKAEERRLQAEEKLKVFLIVFVIIVGAQKVRTRT